MRFSSRTSWDLSEGDLSRAIRERRSSGAEILDLTVSNPTACAFDYDEEEILEALQSRDALTYDPDPRGLPIARLAVVRYYADHGAQVDADQVLLTTSTSEAYSFLFRLLADEGDAVLAAQPSYPLFDFLARLDQIQLEPYLLFFDFGWWIDLGDLERRIGPRTRAIVVVHPNNPTGHWTTRREREQLENLCARRGLALILDEVFLDYGLAEAEDAVSFATGAHPCLTFVVSGLSKIAALPQMKVGWMVVFGPVEQRQEALARLEMIADTFLSMNTPVQLALPAWLAGRQTIVRQIRERVLKSLLLLDEAGIEYLPVAAGWNAILKLGNLEAQGAESDPAIRLVAEHGVVTHPGAFYGLGTRHLVVSLIGPLNTFRAGAQKLNSWLRANRLSST